MLRLVKAQQQPRERALAAAGRADQRQKTPGRKIEIDVVQHLFAAFIRKAEPARAEPCVDGNRPGLAQGARITAVAELENAARRDHRVLQHAQAMRDIHHRLAETAEVIHEHVDHADLHAAAQRPRAEPQHQRRHAALQQYIHHGPEQQRIQLQRGHTRVVMRAALFLETFAKAAELPRELHHADAADALRKVRVDLRQRRAHRTESWPAGALVEPHHRERERQEHEAGNRESPVEQQHGDGHADHARAVRHQHAQHVQVEILHRLGVVGEPRDHHANRRAIEPGHRQPERRVESVAADLGHSSERDACQHHALCIARGGAHALQSGISQRQQQDRAQRVTPRLHMRVDELPDEQRRPHLGTGRGQHQHHGQCEAAAIACGKREQSRERIRAHASRSATAASC